MMKQKRPLIRYDSLINFFYVPIKQMWTLLKILKQTKIIADKHMERNNQENN